MVSGSVGRQRVIEINRSLRIIKNELESLYEKGVFDDDAFDNINRLLPVEASLSSAAATPPPATNSARLTEPATSATRTSPAPSSPPTSALSSMNLGQNPPPSYAQTTGNNAPSLPGRNGPPPPPPPGKPVIAHARALYNYSSPDARDCNFERDDRIAVHEYMNADWWMGRNLRTGHEGIFPRNYVEIDSNPPPPPPANNGWSDEKAGGMYQQPPPPQAGYYPPPQQQYGAPQGYPPAPGPSNPYNAGVPPMAVAEQGGGQPSGGSKLAEGGKKFGKKLGNAAIFGAGATMGADLVNSIF